MSDTNARLVGQVHDAVQRIAQDLESRSMSELGDEAIGSLPHQGLALAVGVSGATLLFDELERQHPGQFGEARDRAVEYLGQQMLHVEMLPSLFNGVVGVLFALRTTKGAMARELDELCDDIEEAIAEWLATDAKDHPWIDVVSGLSGTGIYFCGRPRTPGALRCIGRVVELLEIRAHLDADRDGSQATAARGPGEEDQITANEEVGVAHGVAGVLLFLLHARQALADRMPSLRPLISTASSTLSRTVRGPQDAYRRLITTRPSWCRGELGIAQVLCALGRSLDDSSFTTLAKQLTSRSTAALTHPHVFPDASLCHGWAGAALLYRRLADQLDSPEFATHSNLLVERSLEVRGERGYGGYLFAIDRPDGTTEMAASCGLLSGSSGTALALLSALSPQPLQWERALGVFS